MRRVFLLITMVVISATPFAQDRLPQVIAHRGCWNGVDYIENTPEAVSLAHKLGYEIVELDVQRTIDGEWVVLHDKELCRTMRNAADFSAIENKAAIGDMKWSEVKKHYVVASENPKWRRPLPTLAEMLKCCRKNRIKPMVHCRDIEAMKLVQNMMGDKWICLTDNDSIAMLLRTFSACEILVEMNNVTVEEALDRLKKIGGHCGVSTTNRDMLTETFCLQLRANGYETLAEVYPIPFDARAVNYGVSRLLSDVVYPYNSKVKPTEEWNEYAKVFESGEEINFKRDLFHRGAIFMRLWFRGTMIIVINNEKKYSLTSQGDKMEYISIRFEEKNPSIRIVSSGYTELAEMETKIYKFKY